MTIPEPGEEAGLDGSTPEAMGSGPTGVDVNPITPPQSHHADSGPDVNQNPVLEPAFLSWEQVCVRYKDRDAWALDQVDLQIPRGDFVFLVGPTGAGKSTLLRLMYGDLRPTSGRVVVDGTDVGALTREGVPALRRRMGIVLQDYGLLPRRTVWENVAFACHVIGQSRRETRRKLPVVLEQVGMMHRCGAYPGELSGGEQQRVAIARALVNDPPLLLADEPTGSLDPDTSAGIMDVLAAANVRGTTVVVATHDRLSVDRMRRRVVAIENGRVVGDTPGGAYGDRA
jgi:cell division transport system ATP-binding protein